MSKSKVHAAFVTGSGRNIGRAIALDLARSGHNVVINGLRNRDACEETAEAVKQLGAEALVVMGDIGDATEFKRMAKDALAWFGTIDVVVNNAAIRPERPFLEMSDEDWHRVLAVDLNSAYYAARAFLPGMVARKWGRIINITGMNAMHGYKGRAPVSAAKHGLWGLTKALAKEFGPHGITTNAISPGPISTTHPDDAAMQSHIAGQAKNIPLGRLGTPEEIAALAGFLVSDGGGYVNGQMIACNGGGQT